MPTWARLSVLVAGYIHIYSNFVARTGFSVINQKFALILRRLLACSKLSDSGEDAKVKGT